MVGISDPVVALAVNAALGVRLSLEERKAETARPGDVPGVSYERPSDLDLPLTDEERHRQRIREELEAAKRVH